MNKSAFVKATLKKFKVEDVKYATNKTAWKHEKETNTKNVFNVWIMSFYFILQLPTFFLHFIVKAINDIYKK